MEGLNHLWSLSGNTDLECCIPLEYQKAGVGFFSLAHDLAAGGERHRTCDQLPAFRAALIPCHRRTDGPPGSP